MDRLLPFLNEIEAVCRVLKKTQSKTITTGKIVDRVVDLYKIWITQISVVLEDEGVLVETLKRLTDLFENLISLTSKTNNVNKYKSYINDILRIYNREVILFLQKYSNVLARKDKNIFRSSEYTISDDLSQMINLPTWFIPKSLVGYTTDFRTFLNVNKFDYNVFIMIKYRDCNKELLKSICQIIEKAGFNPIVAKEHKITDDLYNPIACLLCCKYGIAIYDDPEPEQEFNPNVAYELAIMHFLQRPLLLLKSNKLKIPPSDILHKLYEPYKSIKEAEETVYQWIKKLIILPSKK